MPAMSVRAFIQKQMEGCEGFCAALGYGYFRKARKQESVSTKNARTHRTSRKWMTLCMIALRAKLLHTSGLCW